MKHRLFFVLACCPYDERSERETSCQCFRYDPETQQTVAQSRKHLHVNAVDTKLAMSCNSGFIAMMKIDETDY